MTKDVTVAELQSDLRRYLSEASDGLTIRILDDGEPVAQIAPVNRQDDFSFQDPDPALGRLGDWMPPSLGLDWDPVADLIAERDRHR